MKIVFLGTSEFAVPTLQKLMAHRDYEIAAVVTQPDRPAGRKQELLPSPVKVEAMRMGLKIVQVEKLDLETWKSQIGETDLCIVASYGEIIPSDILNLPKFGFINIHPSLLPLYRGPSPIQQAIINGDLVVGVSIMVLDEEMDHGPILGSAKWQMLTPRVKYQQMHDRLAEMGAGLLIDLLPKYLSGELKPAPQDHSKATYTNILTKDDARINWKEPAEMIERKIRAYSEWPVAWTMLEGKRFKIYEADVRPNIPGAPGMIVVDDFRMNVCCGDKLLALYEVQQEGGRRQTAGEFLRGHLGLDSKFMK